MRKTQDIANLICELEYLIGDSCYNKNSVNGYTGEEGCSYRYPVHVYDPELDDLRKTRYRVKNVKFKHLNTLTYIFGSNQIFVGEALIKVLTKLENRYGLDFDKLEKEYQKSLKKSK